MQGRLDRPARASTGTTFICGAELDLVDGGAARRVVERRRRGGRRAPAAASRCSRDATRVGELAQRFGLDREGVEVDERVAHLARQRGLQVLARDDAHPHQQLAERHAAVELLLHQRFVELALVDHAERDQRLADAHHRHLAPGARSPRAAARRRDDLAHDAGCRRAFALRSCCCIVDRLVDLAAVGGLLLDQHLADARADLERPCRRERGMKLRCDAAVVVVRREEEQAELVLDVADRLAAQLAADGAAGSGTASCARWPSRARVRVGRATAAAARSGVVSVSERNWSKRSAQRRARRRHLHVRDRRSRARRRSAAPSSSFRSGRPGSGTAAARSARSAPDSSRRAASARGRLAAALSLAATAACGRGAGSARRARLRFPVQGVDRSAMASSCRPQRRRRQWTRAIALRTGRAMMATRAPRRVRGNARLVARQFARFGRPVVAR